MECFLSKIEDSNRDDYSGNKENRKIIDVVDNWKIYIRRKYINFS